MTARIVGGTAIYVEGYGNTLASICADIADVSHIEEVSPGVYVVQGNKQFRIRPASELIIGDPDDFSVHEELHFNPSSLAGGTFYIDSGGALYMYGDVVLNHAYQSGKAIYAYWYGKLYWRGEANPGGNRPLYTGMYYYNYMYNYSDPAYDDVWDVESINIGHGYQFPGNTAGYAFYMAYAYFTSNRLHRFVDIRACTGAGAATSVLTAIFYLTSFYDQSAGNIEFRDIYATKMNQAFQDSYNSGIHVRDSNFISTAIAAFVASSQSTQKRLFSSKSLYIKDAYGYIGVAQQNLTFIDNCYFYNCYNTIGYAEYGLVLSATTYLVRNTTFESVTADIPISTASQGARILWWTGNSIVNGGRVVHNQGALYIVFSLTVTVQDANGNPIENASVFVRQCNNYEQWEFLTGSDGKIINYRPIDGLAILIHSEATTYIENGGATSEELWSDPSNGTYHEILVAYPGLVFQPVRVAMTEDKSITIRPNTYRALGA